MPSNNFLLALAFLLSGIGTLFLRPGTEPPGWRGLLWLSLLIFFFGAATGYLINGLMATR